MDTGGLKKGFQKQKERREENACEKRLGADRIGRFYASCLLTWDILRKDLEVQGWYICTESSVVCLITLVGHVGPMVQYVKRWKHRNVDGEHGVDMGN